MCVCVCVYVCVFVFGEIYFAGVGICKPFCEWGIIPAPNSRKTGFDFSGLETLTCSTKKFVLASLAISINYMS